MSDQHHNNAALDAETPGLPCPPPPMPWRVPTGYFEQLSASVLERIRIENDALPPVLQSLKDTAAHRPGWPYRVPAGYFDQPQRYASKNKNEQRCCRIVVAWSMIDRYNKSKPAGSSHFTLELDP